MNLPTQSYTLSYFRRHVRGFFQAGSKASMAKGCVVLDAMNRPFIVIRPWALSQWRDLVTPRMTLTRFISALGEPDEMFDPNGDYGAGQIVVTHHDVPRYVVSEHPERKRAANDDATGFTKSEVESLLDASQMLRRAADEVDQVVIGMQGSQAVDARRRLTLAGRSASNAIEVIRRSSADKEQAHDGA